MKHWQALSLGRKVVLAAGVLLFIDTFLAWQEVSVDLGGVTLASASANAWHGFWGVMLGLMTIALVLWIAARAAGLAMPAQVPDGLLTLALGGLILLFALLKNLIDDYSAWASYLGIVIAALVAAGAWLVFRESGEALPWAADASGAGRSEQTTEDGRTR